MRTLLLASFIACLAPSVVRADGDDDARALMRQSAIEQADTVPTAIPVEANATAKARADGAQGRIERTTDAATASAHRAAIAAAHVAASTAAETVAPGGVDSSTARNATVRGNAANAAQRSASGVAQDHAVRGGRGPSGGRP